MCPTGLLQQSRINQNWWVIKHFLYITVPCYEKSLGFLLSKFIAITEQCVSVITALAASLLLRESAASV